MLLRHAKAVQQSRGDDFARDLQDKGKRDAARLGGYLRSHDLVPDVALVSSSARTRQTFEGLSDRKSTRLNSSHSGESRMPSSA